MNLTKDDRVNKQGRTKRVERLQISAKIGEVPDNNGNTWTLTRNTNRKL